MDFTPEIKTMGLIHYFKYQFNIHCLKITTISIILMAVTIIIKKIHCLAIRNVVLLCVLISYFYYFTKIKRVIFSLRMRDLAMLPVS